MYLHISLLSSYLIASNCSQNQASADFLLLRHRRIPPPAVTEQVRKICHMIHLLYRPHSNPPPNVSQNIDAHPSRIASAMCSRHLLMCLWEKARGQSFMMKSANMQTKTPQSKPGGIEIGELQSNTAFVSLQFWTYHWPAWEPICCIQQCPTH